MIRRGWSLFGWARYFWEAVREVNPADVREELERPFLIALYGADGSGRKTLARTLFGVDPTERPGHLLVLAGVGPGAVGATARADLAFLVVDATRPDWSEERRTAQELASRGLPLFVVLTHADLLPAAGQASRAAQAQFPDQPPELTVSVDAREALATRMRLLGPILRTVPSLRLALAHRFPTLRRIVAEDLVRETSRVNAQFALFSSLPALIPVVGTMFSSAADLLILTKNQAMLVYKLAGIYDRDIDDRIGILKEILPVVGAAFAWRSLARIGVGLLPLPLAAIPKTAIAYIGTYVVGEAARHYYEGGRVPSSDLVRQLAQEASERYREVNERLKPRAPTSTGRSDGAQAES